MFKNHENKFKNILLDLRDLDYLDFKRDILNNLHH